MSPLRLQKFLSEAGVCSRRAGERFIQAGRVRVNGKTVTRLGVRVDPQADRVEVDGKAVRMAEAFVYIALHKPRGYVTSCRQSDARTVMELLDIPERVYPVGRLDKDSSGLLLLTSDGRLHHRLSHPSFDHEKVYEVLVSAPISQGALKKMAEGLPMMGTMTRRAEVRRLSSRRFEIALKEGRNRQIRRMVRKVGNRVDRLKRIRVANIRLGGLAAGAWRHLTDAEKAELLHRVGIDPAAPGIGPAREGAVEAGTHASRSGDRQTRRRGGPR